MKNSIKNIAMLILVVLLIIPLSVFAEKEFDNSHYFYLPAIIRSGENGFALDNHVENVDE